MGLLKTIIFIKLTLLSAYLLYIILGPEATVPNVKDEYWGPASLANKKQDESIKEFKINIQQEVLDDLKRRLKYEIDSPRLTPPLENIGFEYGFNTKYLEKVTSYWLTKYDWRQREKELNKFPHFKAKIGGLDIHFQLASNSDVKFNKTVPLLVLHGWPGSFVEFQKIIPLLINPKDSEYSYELIIPSLPGYGFSEGSHRPGMDTVAMANIFKRLMKRLGHEQFYVMGGDWGALIASDMATLYPQNVLGVHSTMCTSMHPLTHARLFLVSLFPSLLAPKEITDKLLPLSSFFSFLMREMGYLHIQATKPDTVGVPLSNSPSGLAAYILEKFSTWTNRTFVERNDGGLLEHFTMDELLDNVMIYWVTNSITTSMRLYSEALTPSKKHNLDKVPIKVPYACQNLAGELATNPEFTLRDKFYNIQQFTLYPEGGHFGAFQVPKTVASDALKFFNRCTKELIGNKNGHEDEEIK